MAEETAAARGHRHLREAGYDAGADIGSQKAAPGYASGGDIAEDKKLVRKAIREHETAEHGGKHAALKLKGGGKVHGKASKSHRPDRKMRGGEVHGYANGGGVLDVDNVHRELDKGSQQPTVLTNTEAGTDNLSGAKFRHGGKVKRANGGRTDSEKQTIDRNPQGAPYASDREGGTDGLSGDKFRRGGHVRRASGGQVTARNPEGVSPKMDRKGGEDHLESAAKFARGGHTRGKPSTRINIIAGGGGDDAAGKQQAMQAGAALGARATAAKLAGAGAGGPPGGPPGGPMPPRPPMAGPPPGGAPMMPPPGAGPMRKGGSVHVREHERRRGGHC